MAVSFQYSQGKTYKVKKECAEDITPESTPARNTRSRCKLRIQKEGEVDLGLIRIIKEESLTWVSPKRSRLWEKSMVNRSNQSAHFKESSSEKFDKDNLRLSNRPVTRDSTRACTRASAAEHRFLKLSSQSAASKKRVQSVMQQREDHKDNAGAQSSAKKRDFLTDLRSLSRRGRESKERIPKMLNGRICSPPTTRSQSLSKFAQEESDFIELPYNFRKFPWRMKRLQALAEAAKRLRAGEHPINIKIEINRAIPDVDLRATTADQTICNPKVLIKKEIQGDTKTATAANNNRHEKNILDILKMEDKNGENNVSKKGKRYSTRLCVARLKAQDKASKVNEAKSYHRHGTPNETGSGTKRSLGKGRAREVYPDEPSTSSESNRASIKPEKYKTFRNPYFTRSSVKKNGASSVAKSLAELHQQEAGSKHVKSKEKSPKISPLKLEPPTMPISKECIEKRTAKLSARKQASLARPVRKYALPSSQPSQSFAGSFWQADLSTVEESLTPQQPIDLVDFIWVPTEEMEVSCEELYTLNVEKLKGNVYCCHATGAAISPPKIEPIDDASDLFSSKTVMNEDGNMEVGKARNTLNVGDRKLSNRWKNAKGIENIAKIYKPSPMDVQHSQRKRCLRKKFFEWNLFDCSVTVQSHQAECSCSDQPDGLDKNILEELAERGRRKRWGNEGSGSPLEDQPGVEDCSN